MEKEGMVYAQWQMIEPFQAEKDSNMLQHGTIEPREEERGGVCRLTLI